MQSSPDSAPGVRQTQSIVLPPVTGGAPCPRGLQCRGAWKGCLKEPRSVQVSMASVAPPRSLPFAQILKMAKRTGSHCHIWSIQMHCGKCSTLHRAGGESTKERGTELWGEETLERGAQECHLHIQGHRGAYTVPTLSENQSVTYVILNDFIPVWSDMSPESLQPRWQVLCRAQAYPTDSLWWVAEWKPQASLSNPAATDHWWLPSTWNVGGPKWDVL